MARDPHPCPCDDDTDWCDYEDALREDFSRLGADAHMAAIGELPLEALDWWANEYEMSLGDYLVFLRGDEKARMEILREEMDGGDRFHRLVYAEDIAKAREAEEAWEHSDEARAEMESAIIRDDNGEPLF